MALGKGLEALIGDYTFGEVDVSGAIELKIIDIEPNKEQPRKSFDKEKLDMLTESIKTHGVIQPILVTKIGDRYQIIAGERRWRAAKNAGLKVVPAIIRDYNEEEIMEVALIENLQREDLNPIEEAIGFKALMDKFSMTQERISQRVGKSRSAVANSLRLLNLSDTVIKLVENGNISSGHAKAILALPSEADQNDIAKLVVSKDMSVRETENFVKNKLNPTRSIIKPDNELRRYIKGLETDISHYVGTKVQIKHNKGKGKIEIEYYSNDDLERLINILKD